jgi:putative transposase
MPRRPRAALGGYVFHVLNRAVGRAELFSKHGDYEAFVKVVRQAHDEVPMRLLAYCLMPNHWHLVLWPYHDGDLSTFMHWLTMTHTQRWHAHYHATGTGPLYQGRFKAFPVQADDHFLTVCRYVERNALRAQLVSQAEAWPWSSLWQREQRQRRPALAEWPVRRPRGWTGYVNEPQTAAELQALRQAVNRGRPFGDDSWQKTTANCLGLQATLRPRGRPPKTTAE